MFNIFKNTFKILVRRPSLIIGVIVLPTILTLGFSYMFGSEMKYSVGLVNQDKGIVSEKVLEKLRTSDTFNIKELNHDELDSAIVGKEVEVAIIFDENFSTNILNGNSDNVKIKSVGESEVKGTLTALLQEEVSTLKTFGTIAKGDKDKFNDLLKQYDESKIGYTLSQIKPKEISVYASVGMLIMIIMSTAFFITRFVIDDEIGGTKDRILLGNVSKLSYYGGTLLTFYLCSVISSLVYFILCTMMNFDFGTDTPWHFLLVLFAVNFFAIGFNLFLVSFSKTPQVAANLSTIFTVAGCMLCGLFWPFYIMPKSVQNIGNMIPLRWASISFEKIQQGSSLRDISIYLFGIVLAGLVCLCLTVIISGKKKSVRR